MRLKVTVKIALDTFLKKIGVHYIQGRTATINHGKLVRTTDPTGLILLL